MPTPAIETPPAPAAAPGGTVVQPPSAVPFIPDSAPFSPEQRAWLNGFMAGFFQPGPAAADGGAAGAGSGGQTVPITVLFGSQTGNAEGLARAFAKKARAGGFAPAVSDMGDYEPGRLAGEEHLLIITSTYGDGEPPDNAAALYDFLHREEAPPLAGVSFSVLALGDSSYPDFCQCGIDFDRRLEALGAQRLHPRVDCDLDFEEPFDGWARAVLEALAAGRAGTAYTPRNGEPAPAGAAPAKPDRPPAATAPAYSKKNPFAARVLRNVNLNGAASAKETRHVELSLEGSGLHYEAGDALGVFPRNCPELVAEVLRSTGLDGGDPVALNGDGDLPLRQALSERFDLRTVPAGLLEACAERSADDALRAAAAGDKAAFQAYAQGRETVDLLAACPPGSFTAPELTGLLKKLNPRLYSIASSPRAHPGEVHLTVGALRYEAHGRERRGTCSIFLAERAGDGEVGVFVHPNKVFRPPADPGAPMVMVGPGTGIAPFRAFLEDRRAAGATGRNWLFFGNPHAATDFLYQDEIAGFQKDGYLHRLDTAFSRDQAEKCYVQHRMLEAADELFAWLEEGASFYVCGDASRMAKDVDAALHQVVAVAGGLGEDAADAYVKELKREKRYARDVY